MAAHSSILAGKIPWTEEPGRLQYIGMQRVRHDGACMHAYFITMTGVSFWMGGGGSSGLIYSISFPSESSNIG